MTFNQLNLNAPLLKALEDLGYTHPTTIQQKAYSVIMSGKDVCGIAQTGTGKTFAYLLPTLRQWVYSKDRNPQILIIVPTRELVVQVVDAVKTLGGYLNLTVVGVYGGVNINTQKLALEDGTDILVGTPGRLIDLVYDAAFKTKNIKKLIIDEVDEMLNLGFRTQLKNILDSLPQRRQNLMFSATMIDEVEELIGLFFNSPITIEAAPTGTPLENIDQFIYHVPNFNTKVNLLKLLLSSDEQMVKVLVFVATKQMADDLYELMISDFPDRVGVIHSNKHQNHRLNTVLQFQQGNYLFLIATDVIARGLDISEVTHVINFDTPEVPESYIHRIGRTGRADRKGISITFVTEKEKEYFDKIEGLMKYQVNVQPLPEDLFISDVLTEDEMPKVKMKTFLVKPPRKEEVGPAFHQKSAKNSKTNVHVSHKDKMMKKYGKPIKKSGKR